ncbi:hypothetical protein OO013_02870 [Mangrovivirga sp. M17]|uniref:RNA polymerase sigma-70 region 2 domain-containing protein n=1 Tax=Mangrovivirga halotolerans TaxID=2993936 RepID=A0ABT3RLU5_9BACT|nr:sigma factor [Mangrovivirga halotolerans]MCX2742790.1 hypothetical protein [Mangrovivirga halotolerans]
MKQSLIWKHYHKPLHNFILYKVKDKDLAEDIIQEVWLALLRSMLENQDISNLVVWLFDKAAKEVELLKKDNGYNKCSLKMFQDVKPKQAIISYLLNIQEMSVSEISRIIEEPSEEVESIIEEKIVGLTNDTDDYLVIN